jgi:hypothetical protein
MKLTVDARQLTEENKQQRELARGTVTELWKGVRGISFIIEREIKQHGGRFSMPRRTGRAAASWGHWSPGLLTAAAKDAGPGDAHWKEDPNDLSVEQGSFVEYIDALNEGHSMQQAAGFLDRAAEHGQKELDKKVDDIIDRYW